MFKLKLHWQILIALLFGVIAGTLIQREFGLDAKETVYVGILKFLGNTVFIAIPSKLGTAGIGVHSIDKMLGELLLTIRQLSTMQFFNLFGFTI